ncbi:MAG TPA: glycosyltransferase family 4 protein [Azonexus sp.]|nr:glycosyltransferase family 4 protein [Azonexus sp.]
MKLAIVRQRYNPFGGAERFVERALAALVAQGTEVSLITRSWEGAARTGFSQVICNPPANGLLAGRKGRDQAFCACVQQAIAAGAFDLVQSHERIPGCSIFRAGDGVHAAWLARRTPTLSSMQRFVQACSPYHRYVLATEQAMFAHPALRAVICNSQMVADEIEQFYGVDRSKLHIIYNGVDTGDFHPRLAAMHRQSARQSLGISESVPLLLYVGSGYERKGVPQLLQAFARLNHPEAHLVVIGADRRLKATKAQAERLGLAGRAHFLGPVQDVRPFYGAADAFVLPTIYDPCPNAALEAMACGLPMLTSHGCGAKEWVRQGVNGWVVDVLDPEALRNGLADLCGCAGQAGMRQAARAAVADLDLPAMSARLLALYQSLAGPDAIA